MMLLNIKCNDKRGLQHVLSSFPDTPKVTDVTVTSFQMRLIPHFDTTRLPIRAHVCKDKLFYFSALGQYHRNRKENNKCPPPSDPVAGGWCGGPAAAGLNVYVNIQMNAKKNVSIREPLYGLYIHKYEYQLRIVSQSMLKT